MAAPSPSALMALPERPLPERGEPKGSDGSDGQFAGLMAHFAQPQAVPKPPEPPQQHASRPDRVEARRDEPGDSRQASGAVAANAKADARPKADAPAAKPETAAPAAEAAPEGEATPARAEQAAAKAALAQALTTVLPKGTELQALVAQAAVGQPANSSDQGTPQLADPSLAAEALASKIQSAPVEARPTLIAPQAVPSPTSELPKAEPLIKVQTPELPSPTPIQSQTPPPLETERPTRTKTTQAALAEFKPLALELSQADALAASRNQLKADLAPTTAKAARAAEPLAIAKGATPTAAKPTQPALPQAASPEEATAAAKHTSQSPTAEATQAALAQVVPEVSAVGTAPLLQSPDGSSLAALASSSKPAASAPVSAVPAAPPAPAPPPTPPVAQVEGSVRWMLRTGAQEARLQLHPESLGQVTIHLKVEGGEVHARLWVTEPASVQAVQEGRPHLEHSLKEQGLQLGSFDLNQGHRPFQEAPSAPAFRGGALAETLSARQEPPVIAQASVLNPHHVELYA